MWHEIFGTEAPIDPTFNKLMAGFESQDVKVVRELWRLGRRALELGLKEIFKIEDNEKVILELGKTREGETWLKEYKEFLLEHGWRCERMHAYDTPAWIEKPSQAIKQIKMLMDKEVFPMECEKRSGDGRKKENRKRSPCKSSRGTARGLPSPDGGCTEIGILE